MKLQCSRTIAQQVAAMPLCSGTNDNTEAVLLLVSVASLDHLLQQTLIDPLLLPLLY
jgi:hypothetical protein